MTQVCFLSVSLSVFGQIKMGLKDRQINTDKKYEMQNIRNKQKGNIMPN